MKFSRTAEKDLLLEDLDGLPAQLLRSLPDSADAAGNREAEERLFPPPCEPGDMRAEWKEFVRPELESLFASADAIVKKDLARLPSGSLRIPAKHTDAWLNTLNRARLVLVERHRFTEEELEDGVQALESPRDLALIQVALYGLLQELLLRED